MKKTHNILSMLLISLTAVAAITGCANDGLAKDSSGGGESGGKGGSMARFTIVGDYIYTVDESSLKIASIANPASPKEMNKINLAGFRGDIETIFPYDGKLFIGSRSAMYIYDISQSPTNPQLKGYASHFRSCDPVVAYGDRAYVTLNNASVNCGSFGDYLMVYDISSLSDPMLLPPGTTTGTYQYNGTLYPTGLGVDGAAGKLFVCTNIGVDVFDLQDDLQAPVKYVTNLNEVVGVMKAYDLIPIDGLLIVVGKDGLFQFDYTEEEITLLSSFDLRK